MTSQFQDSLHSHYPWTKSPLIASAPMRLISTPPLAISVSRAGGLGFLGAGQDLSTLSSMLSETSRLFGDSAIPNTPASLLPIGVGFINWGADLSIAVREVGKWKPAAVWFFAPKELADLVEWTSKLREASPQTAVWVQVGTVASALEVAKSCEPDVLVIQGADAGGHGLVKNSSLFSLLPETADALCEAGLSKICLVAAGGIVEGRGVAAALALGADGVCMGTRFLTSHEAAISEGYKKAILDTKDGGVTTVRTKLYDNLRGTTGWPDHYNGRGIINKSFVDSQGGMDETENKKLYEEALGDGDEGWGVEGRITTYAGTGVGLIKKVVGASEIVEEVRREAMSVIEKGKSKQGHGKL